MARAVMLDAPRMRHAESRHDRSARPTSHVRSGRVRGDACLVGGSGRFAAADGANGPDDTRGTGMTEVLKDVKTLGYMVDGEWRESQSDTWVDITDSNTGEVIAAHADVHRGRGRPRPSSRPTAPSARGPACPSRSAPRSSSRWRPMLLEKMDEIATLVSTELGKNLDEARGEVIKIIEAIDVAVGAPMLMKGESLMNVATGHDTVSYREPLGVFAGIAPFNFPAMIPFGWMLPLCIATGNTFVLKAANPVPLTSHMLLDMLYEAGLPKGVVNMVTAEKEEAEVLLKHPAGPRRQLRRHHAGRQAHLLDRRRPRQARPGADAGQEPRPGAPRRLARARRPRHHQLDLRLRRHALHGAPRLRRRERRRRRVRRLHEAVRRGARRRRRLRPQDGARPGRLRRPPGVGQALDRQGRRRGRYAGPGRPRPRRPRL